MAGCNLAKKVCALFCVLVAAPVPASYAGDTFEEALDKYETEVRGGALTTRTSARARLAKTGDPRALEVFARTYAKPEGPQDQVRYLLAHIGGLNLKKDACLSAWEAWLSREKDPEDTWLWFQGLSVRNGVRGPDDVLGALPRNPSVFLRCAAMEALALRKNHGIARLIDAQLTDLPRNDVERGVLLGSLASAVLSLKQHVKDTRIHPPIRRLIAQIDDDETLDWARLTIARHVAQLLDMKRVTLKTPYLLDALEGKAAPAPKPGTTVAAPRFMGIEATGSRICYVIDLSDSMMTPLTGKERADLRKPVVTGAPAPAREKTKPIEARLDWDKIKTRFDAAREFLKLSLGDLSKEKSFAVVTFGTNGDLLKGTKGMQRAGRANVAKAIRALDSIRPGASTPQRPHGTLRGDTNLHDAMLKAVGVVKNGMTKQAQYVDPMGFVQGCDTIFLLTDGFPTVDNWEGLATSRGGGPGVDRETGERRPGSRTSGPSNRITPGPYAHSGSYLLGDVRRLLLLRKIELHCVGIGEANVGLLRRLSRMGLGKLRTVGKAQTASREGR